LVEQRGARMGVVHARLGLARLQRGSA
jgi:hypothetical protein